MTRRYIHRDENAPGYVYLIEAKTSDGLYKIGLTSNPERRLTQLNSSQSPFHLDYVKLIQVDNMAAVEQSLHQQFKVYGSGKNEWFRFSPKEVTQVITEMNKLENSAAIESKEWSVRLPFQVLSFGANSRFRVAAMGTAFCCIAWGVVFPPAQNQRIASSSNQLLLASTSSRQRCVVAAPLLNVRSGPGVSYPLSGKPLLAGTAINKLGEAGGWVHSSQGWLAASKMRCQ